MIIDGIEVTRGLIIDDSWITKILSGQKTWEMRSSKTKIRGNIALIKKGSGMIVGIAELYDCISCDPLCLPMAYGFHGISMQNSGVFDKWNVAWKLCNVRPTEQIPYKHKRGAVIWVKL